jgi:hypothetical protein
VSDEFQYAVWYWSTGAVMVEIFESERAAAEFAYSMEEGGHASVDGVQRSDGKVENYFGWLAIQEMQQEDKEAFDSRPKEPPPMRKVRNPFGGREVRILADMPTWVGEHE